MSKDRPISVLFFRLDSGREPVREWLKDMRPAHRKTIGEDIKTLQFGWPVGIQPARKMEEGLWELRSHISARIARTLFTMFTVQDCSNARVREEVSQDANQRVGYCETFDYSKSRS